MYQSVIATEQEGQDIIGTLLPIGNYQDYTYINDTKHIYELDNRTNRLKALYSCRKDTVINSVSRDEEGHFLLGSNIESLFFQIVFINMISQE